MSEIPFTRTCSYCRGAGTVTTPHKEVDWTKYEHLPEYKRAYESYRVEYVVTACPVCAGYGVERWP